MKVSKAQKDKFISDGYIIVDVFSKSELKNFKTSVDQIINFLITLLPDDKSKIKKGEELSKGISLLSNSSDDLISDFSDYLTSLPESMRLVGNKRIKTIVNQLLDVKSSDPVYITNATPIVALPNDQDYTYKFHKDTFYTIPESKYIQIWAPLIENATKKNGALQICEKSHKNDKNSEYIKKNVPNRHKYRVSKKELKKYKVRDCKLKMGQVLFFDSGIAHQSGRNSSKNARISLVGVYHKVKNKNIRPMSPKFKFKGKTPEEYFEEINGKLR